MAAAIATRADAMLSADGTQKRRPFSGATASGSAKAKGSSDSVMQLADDLVDEDVLDTDSDDESELIKIRQRSSEDWSVFAAEFEATWARATQGVRLSAAARDSADLVHLGQQAGLRVGSVATAKGVVVSSRPSRCTTIVLNVIGILALVQAWAGFLGMIVGLYLLSAAAWNDDSDATWSILSLSVCGVVIMCTAVAGFVYSRRAELAFGLVFMVLALLIQAGGGAAMILLDLPFVRQAAIGVLGLQLLPAGIALLVYALSELFSGVSESDEEQQAKVRA